MTWRTLVIRAMLLLLLQMKEKRHSTGGCCSMRQPRTCGAKRAYRSSRDRKSLSRLRKSTSRRKYSWSERYARASSLLLSGLATAADSDTPSSGASRPQRYSTSPESVCFNSTARLSTTPRHVGTSPSFSAGQRRHANDCPMGSVLLNSNSPFATPSRCQCILELVMKPACDIYSVCVKEEEERRQELTEKNGTRRAKIYIVK